ncbi:phosphotransferase [Actinotalea ferrariae]|uniref:phosphotransferase n=1 Tax=Actinotalea ferrariae TaxID=1386098 RepID=UPI0009DF2AD6|nr:phosphotransferase [Actinotalea ferrariae]
MPDGGEEPGRPVTPPVWASDLVVDEDLAAHLVRSQFPELAHLPVRRFAAGWDNAVFAVGDELLFRFVHRGVAVPLAARELAVLPALAGRLPLPIPVPTYLGRPVARFDRPFWGGPRIPGEELAVAGLGEDDRVPVARALGGFLRTLHAPDLARDAVAAAAARGVTLPTDANRRGEPTVLRERTVPRLERLRDAGADVDVPALLAVLDTAVVAGPSGGEPVLLHGDLHLRHVLVADDGTAAGVIDWGDSGLGDPAVDLMIGYAAFTGSARVAFLDAYGPLEPGAPERARAVAVGVCAALLDSVLADDAQALVCEVVAALGRVRR